jgi:crotonobetainyl-CoA:carnitine CoA-transferase CaiB-like acyl-CoA transferase
METALNGLRVLDVTRYLAGPYGATLLADLGAEVIKVETPGSRPTAPPDVYAFKGQDAYFLSTNRGKKSIVLDLTKPQGREVFYDLVRKSDVVFDNARPGVMEKLKADYETLKKVNPRIICCSITGFGPTGPDSHRPAFDLVIQAMSGGMSITGEPGRPPVRSGIAVSDIGAGMFGAMGILAALHAREHTGVGQKVETSLLESHISMLVYEAAYYLLSGLVPGPVASGHRGHITYGAYKAKDEYVAVACVNDAQSYNLYRAMGRPDMLTHPKFATPAARFNNREELTAILQEVFLTKPASEWLDILNQHDVPCSRVNTLDKALCEPQVLHRDMVVTIDYAGGGQLGQVGNPIKMSGTPPQVQKVFLSPPLEGQHTDSILSGLLGYPAEKIEMLRREKVVA